MQDFEIDEIDQYEQTERESERARDQMICPEKRERESGDTDTMRQRRFNLIQSTQSTLIRCNWRMA